MDTVTQPNADMDTVHLLWLYSLPNCVCCVYIRDTKQCENIYAPQLWYMQSQLQWCIAKVKPGFTPTSLRILDTIYAWEPFPPKTIHPKIHWAMLHQTSPKWAPARIPSHCRISDTYRTPWQLLEDYYVYSMVEPSNLVSSDWIETAILQQTLRPIPFWTKLIDQWLPAKTSSWNDWLQMLWFFHCKSYLFSMAVKVRYTEDELVSFTEKTPWVVYDKVQQRLYRRNAYVVLRAFQMKCPRVYSYQEFLSLEFLSLKLCDNTPSVILVWDKVQQRQLEKVGIYTSTCLCTKASWTRYIETCIHQVTREIDVNSFINESCSLHESEVYCWGFQAWPLCALEYILETYSPNWEKWHFIAWKETLPPKKLCLRKDQIQWCPSTSFLSMMDTYMAQYVDTFPTVTSCFDMISISKQECIDVNQLKESIRGVKELLDTMPTDDICCIIPDSTLAVWVSNYINEITPHTGKERAPLLCIYTTTEARELLLYPKQWRYILLLDTMQANFFPAKTVEQLQVYASEELLLITLMNTVCPTIASKKEKAEAHMYQPGFR